jgi:Uma2 family endonuclease
MSLALAGIEPPVRIASDELMSLDAFWEFCSENRDLRCERLPNGEIVVMTPTKRGTGSRNGYIVRMLGNWADEDGRGEYYDSSTGFELPDGAVLSPDAAWASFEAVKAAEKDGQELPMCPQFVIELRSESDRLGPAQEKMRLWMSYGAELAWLLDPQRKVVEVYRAGQEKPDVLEGVTSVYGEGPVGGFVLELGKVWG